MDQDQDIISAIGSESESGPRITVMMRVKIGWDHRSGNGLVSESVTGPHIRTRIRIQDQYDDQDQENCQENIQDGD